MRPENLKTKIFLDSGDPGETKEALTLLGFLDGQTTNPTLVAKNPDAKERLERGEKFTKEEIYDFYKGVVREVSELIPDGSVSIEVYTDHETAAEQMFTEGKEMFRWIPNAHIKFPATTAGLTAAERTVAGGGRVNMTLCFSQEQAAAVYAATRGAKRGDVFVSPFVGRLDDRGENGMDLIKNVVRMYKEAGLRLAEVGSHVEVLTASVRSINHFMQALALGSDIVTAPLKALKGWAEKGMPVPGDDFTYDAGDLKPLPYEDLNLSKPWQEFDIRHVLTDKGIERFADDWNALCKNEKC